MNAPPSSQLGASPTILVVEDDLPVSQMACHILRNGGYRAIPARSAEEAAEILLTDDPIDLVFSDIVLPGRSGLELVATLGPEGPAVLITTGQRSAEVRAAVDASGHPLLPKPYTASDLLAAVGTLLGVRP
ncbi:MAG: response regulator [Acidimicrobiales bacterium]|nr:response regulator [Acidimicrobiales bacterium]